MTSSPTGSGAWLDAQPAESVRDHVRHLRLAGPLLVTMNGRTGGGLVSKPASSPG